jgi:hypothetical protein
MAENRNFLTSLDESVQQKYSCHYASHDGYEIAEI